jgi:hypothetical protein
LVRIGQRLVDGFAQFFHEVFQLLVHESPVPTKSESVIGCRHNDRRIHLGVF